MISKRVYGTWYDPTSGLLHFASGVKLKGYARRRGEWDSNLLCGGYVDEMSLDVLSVVTCVRCLWKWLRPRNPHDVLRGLQTDRTIIDESQNFDLANTGLFKLLGAP